MIAQIGRSSISIIEYLGPSSALVIEQIGRSSVLVNRSIIDGAVKVMKTGGTILLGLLALHMGFQCLLKGLELYGGKHV